jgi:hypothetical protein
MFGKQLYIHNDTAYIVLDQQSITTFVRSVDAEPNMEMVQVYMQWRRADHVLRTQTHFLFCETIQEAVLDTEE